MENKIRDKKIIILTYAVILLFIYGCYGVEFYHESDEGNSIDSVTVTVSTEEIPEYQGNSFVILNNNEPMFDEGEITDVAYEDYGAFDFLGRCGSAEACVGEEIMPTEERGSIGDIKPTGWHTIKYDCVDGKYLYNRCHLIGYQLTGENSNEQNLITGTRYMNVEGMLPFENMVADYVKETKNHVMYRVTPFFEEDNLVASGVSIEAYSVEDQGEGLSFCVYCYNVQPGIEINYKNGESWLDKSVQENAEEKSEEEYVLNTNTYKYHLPTCKSVNKIAEYNKQIFKGDKENLEKAGYSKCKNCNP